MSTNEETKQPTDTDGVDAIIANLTDKQREAILAKLAPKPVKLSEVAELETKIAQIGEQLLKFNAPETVPADAVTLAEKIQIVEKNMETLGKKFADQQRENAERAMRKLKEAVDEEIKLAVNTKKIDKASEQDWRHFLTTDFAMAQRMLHSMNAPYYLETMGEKATELSEKLGYDVSQIEWYKRHGVSEEKLMEMHGLKPKGDK